MMARYDLLELSHGMLAVIRCRIFRLPVCYPKIKLYRPIIVQHEGRRLREFENRVLRRIFGRKRDEMIGEWRKLHDEELNDMYSTKYCSGDKIEKNEICGACSMYGGDERCIQGFGGET
jgi:hypothetical protein